MDIVFDYEKILSFQGESLIYVNYVYARINSIIKKANLEKFHLSLDGVSFSEEFLSTVRNLIVLMGRSRDVLHDSVESLKPNLLLEHVLEMCNVFNGIYEENRILGSNYEREFLVVLDALRRQLRKLCEFLNLQLEEEL
jgi:arginyl-tRNA synthetase